MSKTTVMLYTVGWIGERIMIGEFHIHVLFHNYLEINETWNESNMYSTCWRMYINNHDGAELIFPRSRYPLKKNRIHLVPAWLRFSLHNTRPLNHFYFHFDLVGINTSIHKKVFHRPFTLNDEVDFESVVHSVLDLPGDLPKLCRVKSMAYQYVTELLTALPASHQEEISQSLLDQTRFASTLHYIENHLAQPLTNEFLASLSHMSESHFGWSFKKLLGQTPAQYVLQRRIAWAAQQLLYTPNTIDAIAEEAGFANRFHFSRQFTRYMGTPPGAYRKSSHS